MVATPRPQRTIDREVGVSGIGFLTGADVRVMFKPAAAGAGVRFIRDDLPGCPAVEAHIDNVIPRQRRTTIQKGEAIVEMVEHVMAALSGLHIDNCDVIINASETPGGDGSSSIFVAALAGAGITEQDRPREVVTIDQPITVREGPSTITAHPGQGSDFVLAYNLDYGPHSPIGKQSLFLNITPETFQAELADSRTFLLEAEAQALRKAGIGSRTSAKDLLIFGPNGVIDNQLRYPDECVRHKILDIVGDLALLGKDIQGHVVAFRSGHQLNAALVREIRQTSERKNCSTVPSPLPLDIRAIMKTLPHRYPFLLVDRVLELEPGKRIRAIKNVSCNEPFFAGHWPNRPIMPGVLIVEALAQAAGIMFADRLRGLQRCAFIVGINHVKIRRPVVPGDQLVLDVQSLKSKEKLEYVLGFARVDDEIAAEAKIRFMLVEADCAA